MDLYQIWVKRKEEDKFYRRLGDECFAFSREECLERINKMILDWSRHNIEPDPNLYYLAKVGEGLEEVNKIVRSLCGECMKWSTRRDA